MAQLVEYTLYPRPITDGKVMVTLLASKLGSLQYENQIFILSLLLSQTHLPRQDNPTFKQYTYFFLFTSLIFTSSRH
jgi:hypothetical protein